MAHKWIQPQVLTKADLAKLGDDLYKEYNWLCKYKHPTLAAAVHDAMSRETRGANDEAPPAVLFGMRVGQDTREIDLANKSMVLFLVLQQVGMAVLWTARTEGLRWPDSYSLEWSEAILRAVEQFRGAFDACGGPLAFDHAGFIPLGYQGAPLRPGRPRPTILAARSKPRDWAAVATEGALLHRRKVCSGRRGTSGGGGR